MSAAGLRTRSFVIDRAQVDEARRTVPASLSSEAPVSMGGTVEILRHTPDAIDLSRAAGGLPLLFSHDRTAPIGVVENVRLDARRLVGQLRFGQSARAAEVLADVRDGVLKHLSISYRVDEREPTDTGYIATRWSVYEASIVSVPADFTVGIGRASAEFINPQGALMSKVETRETDDADIRAIVKAHRLEPALADSMIGRQLSYRAACDEILERLARRDEVSGGPRLNVTPDYAARGNADGTMQREQMIDALAARMGGPKLTQENSYRHARMPDLARDCLERCGIKTTSMSPGQLVERALHTTSDFPDLLTGSGQRVLGMAYSSYAGGIKRVAKASSASDFRVKQRLMLGEAPELLRVNEHSEFKYGGMASSKESYSLGTFGRIFGISRQALVNDDLDAFGDMAMRLGRAASEFEAKFLVTLLTSNPTMGDTVALFHADHGNLGTGAGSALSVTSLTAARLAMRLQKGLDGATPIDASPRFLIVPGALETAAEQLLTTITPATTATVNPFAGKLELVVDPRLDTVSSTAWYLAADPALIDGIEYSYLAEANGPEVFAEPGFEVDGVALKVRLDFGAGVLDWRGLYKANGA